MDKGLWKTLPVGVAALMAWGMAPAWADAGGWEHFERMRRVSDCTPGYGLQPDSEEAARGVKGRSEAVTAIPPAARKTEGIGQLTDAPPAMRER